MANIYEFSDYRNYLVLTFKTLGVRQGHKLKAAQAIGVQPAYLSRILKGVADLSVEQAFDLADHLELSPNEKQLFLLLVQKERAGTHQLKSFFEDEIRVLKDKRKELKNLLESRGSLTSEEKAHYYSHSHIALIPNRQQSAHPCKKHDHRRRH